MTLASRPSRLLTDPVLPEMRQGVSFAVLAHAQLFQPGCLAGDRVHCSHHPRTPVAAAGTG